eukprot:TRINITY_DN3414_c0_g1_i3.p1 TRINITY_DN3414_c0_g1~~TRINITY_DN3414_c0_g1_i3.p1  ORF type:complete len:306 (-),score=-25.76 TRINITY_DN3414_c0_g1_i3:54-971(-)
MEFPKNKHKVCAVPLCNSPQENHFHSFPRSKDLASKWATACNREYGLPKYPVICHKHFTEDSYQRDLRNELLNLPTRRILKPDAVPTLFLTDMTEPSITPPSKTQSHGEVLKRKALIEELIRNYHKCSKIEDSETPSASDLETFIDREVQVDSPETLNKSIQTSSEDFYPSTERKTLLSKINDLREELRNLKKKNVDLRVQNRRLSTKRYKRTLIQTELSKKFTPAQVSRITGSKKRSNWGKEDIANGIILHSLSKRAYSYIRSKNTFPLPGISTLRSWIKDFHTSPGIQHELIKIITENESFFN